MYIIVLCRGSLKHEYYFRGGIRWKYLLNTAVVFLEQRQLIIQFRVIIFNIFMNALVLILRPCMMCTSITLPSIHTAPLTLSQTSLSNCASLKIVCSFHADKHDSPPFQSTIFKKLVCMESLWLVVSYTRTAFFFLSFIRLEAEMWMLKLLLKVYLPFFAWCVFLIFGKDFIYICYIKVAIYGSFILCLWTYFFVFQHEKFGMV